MTKTQLKLMALMLEKACREFARHGCNDFLLKKEAGLTDAEIAEVRASLREYDEQVNGGDHLELEGEFAFDWCLMHWLAWEARKEAA